MERTETIVTRSGLKLEVKTTWAEKEVEVVLRASKDCLLHWGVRKSSVKTWQLPLESAWPAETKAVGDAALETPLPQQNSEHCVRIHLSPPADYDAIEFVLFYPEKHRWDNNEGRNYQIAIGANAAPAKSVEAALRSKVGSEPAGFERLFELEGGKQLGAGVVRRTGGYQAFLLTNVPGRLLLHWGVAHRSPQEWQLPPELVRPPNTEVSQNQSAQTPFALEDGLNALQLDFSDEDAPLGVQFVLKQNGEAGRWINFRGGNFYVPILSGAAKAGTLEGGSELADWAEEIIRAETTHNSWTLMHRFNMAYDFCDRVNGSLEGWALLFVWLRFSAIRQLTWQRNYNTKPRELAHAQDRLTQKLAEIHRTLPDTRPLVRLILTTVGRGGEGQRIRDEILAIMHRHHVKEVSGHFLEEWHQKLHNNTTPDDVVICEAYLEFLRSNGNLDRFYKVLEASGVTRQRLESFERPIRSSPQFVGHLKDALIHDFQEFLGVLKSSHSGTDFDTAVGAAWGLLDGELQGLIKYVGEHRQDQAVGELAGRISEARRRLSRRLEQGNGLRELLYLDLALEQLLRVVVERNIHLDLSDEQWADLLTAVLDNLTLSYASPELGACLRHWKKLQGIPRFGAEWSLQAKAVSDRIGRGLSAWIDWFYQLLQPKAEYLGHGFQAEPWTITLFSEEVVRGNSLGFALSMLLRHLDPVLRKAAHLGNWQIVSRGRGQGKVEVVEALRMIQGKRLEGPTVVLAEKVMGDEELPEGVTAVIAPDVTDIVSHVAVRARNAHVLFAACHDPAELERLKALRGHSLQLEVSPSGDVIFEEIKAAEAATRMEAAQVRPAIRARSFSRYAVGLNEFNEEIVGGKSIHQARLRGKVPEWVHLPASAAVPFGVFEKVLSLEANQSVAQRYGELVRQADQRGTEVLADLRRMVLELKAPQDLRQALREAMDRSGLAWPKDWERAWERLKQVWASKWNERAFLSRQRLEIKHQDLSMAVLIQELVPADYAFVIHTVNPSTGNAEELFAEVVLGLGETLVGNYPGRALSFVWNKKIEKATVLSYPSKSTALYGGGLIFRSDSNGEDLAGYAGAGLYDSVLLDSPRAVPIDYTGEPLIWDPEFRQRLLAQVARIGLEVARACDSPQDIEGAVAKDKYYVVQTRPQAGA